MRWDHLTFTAFGGIAGLAHANQERLKERIETLEAQAVRREWREPTKAP